MSAQKPPHLRDYSWMLYLIVPAFILFIFVFGPIAEKDMKDHIEPHTPTAVPTVTAVVTPPLPNIGDTVDQTFICYVIDATDQAFQIYCQPNTKS